MDKSCHKEHNVVSMTDYQPESGYAAIAPVSYTHLTLPTSDLV